MHRERGRAHKCCRLGIGFQASAVRVSRVLYLCSISCKVPKICIKKYVPEATKAARQMVKKNIEALDILQLSSSDQKDRLNCFDKTH